jgi:hypothetical protein
LTEVGLKYKQSFVSAEGRPYWWSDNGIHTLVYNGEVNSIVEQNVSQSTIHTFFKDLTEDQRLKVRAVYDALNKRVMWMYPDVTNTGTSQVDHILLFDEIFTAFYPWTISTSDYIVSAFYYPETVPVTASSGIKVLVRRVGDNTLTFGEFDNPSFLDWETEDYSSFAEAGYDFMGDLTTFKNAPYITSYMMTTEEGFDWNGSGYDPTHPSSCFMKAYWDFRTEPSSSQQIYKLKHPVVVDEDNLLIFNYPETVVTARTRVRGRGRSMRLRFESETEQDFHLLGWEVIGAKNPSF